ncbi:MAG: F0F1 ATP synthase subunit A [Candidatus Saccharimonadales bacterium]
MNLLRFAAEDGPHIAIAPDTLFTIGGFPITNSMLYGWLCAILLIWVFIAARKRIKLGGTKGPAALVEAGVEFIINLLQQTLGDRRKALQYGPIFVTLFFFIMLNNWLGLLPGIGPAIEYNGTPLLRAFTADLNATFAMALFGMILVQVIAIRESGPKNHLKHYFPMSPLNPLTYLVGAFEIFTELTRLISLGLRLFLNIAIGEVLISVASFLGGPAASLASLPFTLLEIFVGALQAYIFVVLCAAYLSATTTAHGGDEHEEAPQV